MLELAEAHTLWKKFTDTYLCSNVIYRLCTGIGKICKVF